MRAIDPGFSSRERQARDVSDVGALLGDRYRIEGLLREDATTSTVLARHLALEERVAVQVLRPEPRFDQRLTVQYLQAIKSLARLESEHVARVLDVGVALFLGPFMVMEDVEGVTLREVLRAEGPLRLPRAVDYVLQACKGLAVAHAAGIVHGQLDTSRLLLARRGEFETLKVIDFPTLDLTPAARDRRTDVWSLGAVLCELVTGRPELASDDVGLSPALRQIIVRCLQPEPAQRFADVGELAAELLPLTTLNEVFRGSLTGSFSRQMMMAAAASARAESGEERAAPPPEPAWRERMRRLRASWPEFAWQERWRGLEQTWQQIVPEGPPLPRALGGAGAAALIALGCAWLGRVQLIPPPRPRAPAAIVASSAPAAAPVALEAAPELSRAATTAAAEPPGAVPETVEHTLTPAREAQPTAQRATSPALRERLREKRRRARHRQ